MDLPSNENGMELEIRIQFYTISIIITECNRMKNSIENYDCPFDNHTLHNNYIFIAATECIVDQDFVFLIFKMCTQKRKEMFTFDSNYYIHTFG